ncbi:MAG: hypothetical protein ACMXYF_04600 [Candidatus Woesearchaeota archaeon]
MSTSIYEQVVYIFEKCWWFFALLAGWQTFVYILPASQEVMLSLEPSVSAQNQFMMLFLVTIALVTFLSAFIFQKIAQEKFVKTSYWNMLFSLSVFVGFVLLLPLILLIVLQVLLVIPFLIAYASNILARGALFLVYGVFAGLVYALCSYLFAFLAGLMKTSSFSCAVKFAWARHFWKLQIMAFVFFLIIGVHFVLLFYLSQIVFLIFYTTFMISATSLYFCYYLAHNG